MTPVSSQATPIIKEKWGFQKAECWRSKGSFCWTTTAPQGCNYRCTTAKWCVDNFCPALFLLELPPHHSSLVQEAPWSSTASVCNGNIQEPLLKLLPTTWWNPPASPKQLLTEANSRAEKFQLLQGRGLGHSVVTLKYRAVGILARLVWPLKAKSFSCSLGKVLSCRLCLSSGVKCPAFQHCRVMWCLDVEWCKLLSCLYILHVNRIVTQAPSNRTKAPP